MKKTIFRTAGRSRMKPNGKPNILFLMADMMQNRVLDPDHPCLVHNLDRLAGRGLRFNRAYSPCPICSPARASLMTGLLPHNHGVIENPHTLDPDQSVIRSDRPHWAQRLRDEGYRTGYFGKWHVERTLDLRRYGWEEGVPTEGEKFQELRAANDLSEKVHPPSFTLTHPPGYGPRLIYGVTEDIPEKRNMGITADLSQRFMEKCISDPERPWCCFVSFQAPHHPFVVSRDTIEKYDLEQIPLSPSGSDDLEGRPGLYRKAAEVWKDMTDRQRREASAFYYARITEADGQIGRLLHLLDESGQSERTIVVFTSDHGQLDGAHGLFTMNCTASEELHNIPLIIRGPGVPAGKLTDARVGLHDLCPTLMKLSGSKPFDSSDSRSFASVLDDPEKASGDFTVGFSEYYGSRYKYSNRVIWDDDWKYVINGFDYNELYNLREDPYEVKNLARDPARRTEVERLMVGAWNIMKETGDHTLVRSDYPTTRLAPVGPDFHLEDVS